MTLKINDRVKIVRQVYSHKRYPFIPKLIGKEGIIEHVQTWDDAPNEAVYQVRLDQSFRVGMIPEGEHAFNYNPTQWREEQVWALTGEELTLLSE